MFIYAVIQCLQYGNSVAGREMIHPKNSLFRSLAYRVSVYLSTAGGSSFRGRSQYNSGSGSFIGEKAL